MHLRVAAVTAVIAAASLTACGTAGGLHLDQGWSRVVSMEASWELDAEFDVYTGEILPQDDGGTDGLSLPDEESALEAVDVELAMTTAERSICERYIATPLNGEEYENQRAILQRVLTDAAVGSAVRENSDAYIAARRDVQAWLSENAPDTTQHTVGSPEYAKAWADWEAAHDRRWEEEYPRLAGEAKDTAAKIRTYAQEAHTSGSVRAAQELILQECQIDVPDGYVHPSPAKLGIDVDEEYVRKRDAKG